jgi:hypothetical protein
MLRKRKKSQEEINRIKQDIDKRNAFFLKIWQTRPHYCINCKKWLGNEPFSYMFDHLLEKSKYPDLKYEEINICLLCLECHDNKTRGFISKTIQQLMNKVKEIFKIN